MIELVLYDKDMNTTQNTEDLNYSIAKATENIAKALKLGRKDIAQQIRRERRGYIAKLEAVAA